MTTHHLSSSRSRLAALMDFLVAHEPHVHYPPNDRRTMSIHTISAMSTLEQLVTSPKGLTVDCSQSAQLIFHVAGWADPCGLDYRIDGTTRSMLAHLGDRAYTKPSEANVGALFVFGPGTGDHVAICRHPGANPTLFSHGQEKGPLLIPYQLERAAHRPPVRILPVTSLDPDSPR